MHGVGAGEAAVTSLAVIMVKSALSRRAFWKKWSGVGGALEGEYWRGNEGKGSKVQRSGW